MPHAKFLAHKDKSDDSVGKSAIFSKKSFMEGVGVGVYYQKGVVWRLKCDLHPLLRLLRSLIFMSRQNIGLKIKVKVFI